MPVHGEYTVIKDITEWKKYVKETSVVFTDEEWSSAITHANSVDRNEQFVTVPYFGGIFEMCHNLMSMENALIAFYEEPYELIDYITEQRGYRQGQHTIRKLSSRLKIVLTCY